MNDPALRKVCEPVALEELDHIKSLVPDMLKIMSEEGGIALAANQVGVIKRFFVMSDGKLIINPTITKLGPLSPYEEGCLSIPGVSGLTVRAQELTVSYKDETFSDITVSYNGLEAVAIQHEIDHLDGILYIDQIAPVRRHMLLEKYRKLAKIKGRKK